MEFVLNQVFNQTSGTDPQGNDRDAFAVEFMQQAKNTKVQTDEIALCTRRIDPL